jgi:hypothetical protein
MPVLQLPFELPQDVKDQLLTVMKDKLPAPVDDAILSDIIETHRGIISEYIKSQVYSGA